MRGLVVVLIPCQWRAEEFAARKRHGDGQVAAQVGHVEAAEFERDRGEELLQLPRYGGLRDVIAIIRHQGVSTDAALRAVGQLDRAISQADALLAVDHGLEERRARRIALVVRRGKVSQHWACGRVALCIAAVAAVTDRAASAEVAAVIARGAVGVKVGAGPWQHARGGALGHRLRLQRRDYLDGQVPWCEGARRQLAHVLRGGGRQRRGPNDTRIERLDGREVRS